ncbi:hypothetical protein [Streptomyces albidoflavus]|uniref:hypothetical protein n=1 Tax=Streptomyces albidoflavus TaxID=1886 RepID=UPI0033F41092
MTRTSLAQRATVGWIVLSSCWVVGITQWDGLARDPGVWTPICLGVAAMLATVLVFVVTLAPLLVQMQFRHTAGLAVSALDGSAVAYAVFFISSTILPVLAAAAPSRPATVAVAAGLVPVLGSLVPAVLVFVRRLRSSWLLQRRVARAVSLLARAPGKRRPVRREQAALEAGSAAAGPTRVVMRHAGESYDDRNAARQSAVRLLRAAATTDTHARRRWIVEEIKALTWLGREHRSASVRRDVVHAIETAAHTANRSTGREIISTVLTGLQSLGEGNGVTSTERLELARAVRGIVISSVVATAARVRPHDVRRGAAPARPEHAARPGPWRPWQFENQRVVDWQVLEQGVRTFRALVGPPVRPMDDSWASLEQANTFAGGCRILAELTEDLLKAECWVDYGPIIDCLDTWQGHRLGAGPDRVDDLAPKGDQQFPYAVELEAASRSLAAIATAAYSHGFDHVARAALSALVRQAESGLRKDAVAFVVAARALEQARRALFGPGDAQVRDLAAHARAADLLSALQEENRRLLLAVAEETTRLDFPENLGSAMQNALHEVHRWALRPLYRLVGGHGQLALDIARTAQSVRRPERVPFSRLRRGAEPSDAELHRLSQEARAFSWRRELVRDPAVCLAAALHPEKGNDPGVSVHHAAVRWRTALEAAGKGLQGGDGGYDLLTELAGHGPEKVPGLSKEASAFGRRIAAWTAAPWCPAPTGSPHWYVPDADDLLYIPAALGTSASGLREQLRQYRAERRKLIEGSGFADLPYRELCAAGVLWGTWPPPPGTTHDPWEEPDWSSEQTIRHRVEDFRSHREAGRLDSGGLIPDRVYHARTSGRHRIVVVEPDGSARLLSGVTLDHDPFSLTYGGTGADMLARLLTLDALGRLARCPVCHGGSAADLMPGWCPTCRGLRTHPDLPRAQRAIVGAVAQASDGAEWHLSRTELLDAMAG